MYSEEQYIDNGEAMRHNQLVEQARQAEHLRRSAESPAYKRVYERCLSMKTTMQREQLKVFDAMQQAIQQQPASNVMKHCDPQSVRIGPSESLLPLPSELNQLTEPGGALGILVFGVLFMTEEQRAQIHDNVKAIEEMCQVNKEYDRQLIRKSCFEW